jgi:molybdopterin synthase catalytic subunit
MISLTYETIDSDVLVRQAQTPAAGAVLLFLGVTRRHTDGRETTELTYDSYEKMAEKELTALKVQALKRWGLVECLITHRLGTVPLGEASVAIVVASPHRRAAFEAGEWLIDTLKERVPIWKQEHWADGTSEWVHPTKAVVSE